MKNAFGAGYELSRTTWIYTHAANRDLNFIKNPLD